MTAVSRTSSIRLFTDNVILLLQRHITHTETLLQTKEKPTSLQSNISLPSSKSPPFPPSSLTTEEESRYEQVLQHFQRYQVFPVSSTKSKTTNDEAASEWEKMRYLTRESILRYLRTSQWDVELAINKLIDTIVWSRSFGVNKLDIRDMELEAICGKEMVLGYDKLDRPLHYLYPHRNTTQESHRQIQFTVWMLERCIDLMPPGVEQLVLLINFDKKKKNPTSLSNAKEVVQILQGHYVDRLGIAICVNVPWILKIFWKAIFPFIDPKTREKCLFNEDVGKIVPLEHLHVDFGGTVNSNYNHSQYWPQLLEATEAIRKEMVQRFREHCQSQIGASEWLIKGGEMDIPTSTH